MRCRIVSVGSRAEVPDVVRVMVGGREAVRFFRERTCHMSVPVGGWSVCTGCGALVRAECVACATEALPMRHCPSCGARVTKEDVIMRDEA